MTTDAFFAKYTGKFIDFDGYFGCQCFDLYRQYCKEGLDVPQSPPTGSNGAATIWDTYLSAYFTKIPNTPTNVPKKGDIIVWNKWVPLVTGAAGHVAIFSEGDVNNFISFDQNWGPTGSPCGFKKHSYRGVLGWLRCK